MYKRQLPGLEESSRDAADLLRERDEELADLSTKNVDPAVTAYVAEDRDVYKRQVLPGAPEKMP